MPGAVRLSDMSTGHPHCYPATPAVGASQNVIVNGRGQNGMERIVMERN